MIKWLKPENMDSMFTELLLLVSSSISNPIMTAKVSRDIKKNWSEKLKWICSLEVNLQI